MAANPDLMEQTAPRGTLLIVDDEAVNRLVVRRMLAEYAFDVIEATNGREACEVCLRMQPDLILMDIMMPIMNGLDATVRIKRHFGETHVPVIFLTAVSDERELLRCIEVGGDDFLVKPISGPLLKAKIDSSLRLLAMQRRLAVQRDELLQHTTRVQGDMEIAKKILEAVESQHHLDAENVRYLLRPMEILNGDLILGARRPSGDQVFLVGDFTGHGLPAAIGAQTVSGIFNAMVGKGLALVEIVNELNRKMRALLPVGRFLSACLLEVSRESGLVRVWNGGMPEVLARAARGGVRESFASTDLPLGIVDDYAPTVSTGTLMPGDMLIVHSDGVLEAHDAAGELFGQERLLAAVATASGPAGVLDGIVNAVSRHVQDATQNDDLSILVVEYRHATLTEPELPTDEQATLRQRAMTWKYSVVLSPGDLRVDEPVAKIIQVIDAAQGIGPIRTQLFLILTELYSNALEHGLLGLDSRLKEDPEGFGDYYAARAERLAALDRGSLTITCTHAPSGSGGCLQVSVAHDGVGFDVSVRLRELAENREASGRGIPLVKSLCDSLEYSDEGRCATACYRWRSQ
ncbi:MAG: SpoIIE family protein phosphatase [Gammaproteobacteria bacterium]